MINNLFNMVHKELYNTLGVKPNATEKEIKSAFRSLAKIYHPDKENQYGEQTVEDKDKYRDISNAYTILSDKNKRQIYDTQGLAGFKSTDQPNNKQQTSNTFTHSSGQTYKVAPDNEAFNNIFSTFFPDSYAQPNDNNNSNDNPSEANILLQYVNISVKETYLGCNKTVNYEYDEKCLTCDGSGHKSNSKLPPCNKCNTNKKDQQKSVFGVALTTCTECNENEKKLICISCKGKCVTPQKNTIEVEIKPGMTNGYRLNYEQLGHYIPTSKKMGDLHIEIILNNTSPYIIDGHNLKIIQKISLAEAYTGIKRNINFVDDTVIQISSPLNKIVQPGTKLVYRGQGLPIFDEANLNTIKYGDLTVEFQVILPKIIKNKTEFLALLNNP